MQTIHYFFLTSTLPLVLIDRKWTWGPRGPLVLTLVPQMHSILPSQCPTPEHSRTIFHRQTVSYLRAGETGKNVKKKGPMCKDVFSCCSVVVAVCCVSGPECHAAWEWVNYDLLPMWGLYLGWFSASPLCNGTYCGVWLMVVSEKCQCLSLHSRAEKLLLFRARYSIFK